MYSLGVLLGVFQIALRNIYIYIGRLQAYSIDGIAITQEDGQVAGPTPSSPEGVGRGKRFGNISGLSLPQYEKYGWFFVHEIARDWFLNCADLLLIGAGKYPAHRSPRQERVSPGVTDKTGFFFCCRTLVVAFSG